MLDRGILLAGVGTSIPETVAVAKRAEAAGFDSVYCVEAYRNGLTMAAAIAAGTERIRIGPYVLNAFARTPFATGLAAIDLDDLSGGRLMLGIGSGNRYLTEQWLGEIHERPLAKMRDSVEIVRRMLRSSPGDTVAYAGRIHSINWSPSAAPFRRSVPVVMAGIFPKMRALAGEIADGLAIGAVTSSAYVRDVIRPAVFESLERAGRDPESFRFLITGMSAVDTDRERARSALRATIAGIFVAHPHPYYEFMLREQGFGKQLDRCLAEIAAGRVEAAADTIDDRMIDELAIGGTPTDCAEQTAVYDGLVDEMIYTDVSGLIAHPDREPLDVFDIPLRASCERLTAD
jgi:alkanesulfonate monooxygenase SsuD/methylene tetrahydromethanopterin reductase-like flavin-dependent oxidoreductase (luciferase family)